MKETVMIARMFLFLALVCSASAAWAQEPACTFYKVDTNTLPISKDAGGDRVIDALFEGDVACVTKKTTVKGVEGGSSRKRLSRRKRSLPSMAGRRFSAFSR
jgi:hypothetical protein